MGRFVSMLPLLGAIACRDSSRVDVATLEHTASGVRLRVTILGPPTDPRMQPIREAIAHWNREFVRLGRHVQLDAGTIINYSVPDDILLPASGEAPSGGGSATARLHASLSGVPGDIIIALSETDLISFSVRWDPKSKGVVGIRRSDILPLSPPNTVRNVALHELGHVLGLPHNLDFTTLMCGRPAPCRPAAFASDTGHFFPLTTSDEQRLRKRWP
jgi:hypothetical protein